MTKRRLIAALIALVLTIAVTGMWSAATIEREGDPDANAIEDSGSSAGVSEQKKGGNRVVKVLAAPFKAFGRLFGHNGDRKIERMTEKDAEKFASVGVTRVDDARTVDAKKLVSTTAKEHLAAGREYLMSGRINEAVTELSTAASLDPKLSEAHNLLGVAYDQKGLAERAQDSYKRAIQVEPEDPETLNNLGFSFYQNGNYRAAVDRLKRAARLAPTDERILNNLGLALCRLGKFDEAYKSFARATGGSALRAMTFAQRGAMLRSVTDALQAHRAPLDMRQRRLLILCSRGGAGQGQHGQGAKLHGTLPAMRGARAPWPLS